MGNVFEEDIRIVNIIMDLDDQSDENNESEFNCDTCKDMGMVNYTPTKSSVPSLRACPDCELGEKSSLAQPPEYQEETKEINVVEILNDILRLNNLDGKELSERSSKLFEESGELAQALNNYISIKGTEYKEDKTKLDVLEEGADTIQMVLSILFDIFEGHNPKVVFAKLLEKIDQKNDKWEQKIKELGDYCLE